MSEDLDHHRRRGSLNGGVNIILGVVFDVCMWWRVFFFTERKKD